MTTVRRFLEICSSCGVVAGERPVKLEGLDDLINALEGEIEDRTQGTPHGDASFRQKKNMGTEGKRGLNQHESIHDEQGFQPLGMKIAETIGI